ncbi:hypothetical protein DID88_000378 [Monilinia fructigena]|uniref:Uncharacterized protein n=1 Tax=Monilinia fructigena TaxID=38457 RepID=A0A395IMY9_9HELO|nr:hypothetical protein DID88_000378 [Monilinia fructigena]
MKTLKIDAKILDVDSDTFVVENQGQAQSSIKQSKDTRPVKRARIQKKLTKKVLESDSDDNSSTDDISSSDTGWQ